MFPPAILCCFDRFYCLSQEASVTCSSLTFPYPPRTRNRNNTRYLPSMSCVPLRVCLMKVADQNKYVPLLAYLDLSLVCFCRTVHA